MSMIANVWALSCALDLGLLCESSLKEVVIASYSELNSLFTTEDAGKSPDLETDDHEDDACKSASIFGNSWPFIDPARIKRITRMKPVRRRRRKTRWSVRRQKKPRDACPRIDGATADLPTKRSTSLRKSERENLAVSHDRPARLSARANASSTRTRVFVGDERLPESYRSTDDEEEEVISQTTSETSSADEIASVDYPGYSRFSSPSHAKEDPQNRLELSEYPDYFSVLRIDNSTENNDFDTWEDVMSVSDTSRDNARTAKLAKFAKRRASRKILENKNAPHRTGRASSRKNKLELKINEDRFEMLKKKRNRLVGRKRKKTRNSAAHHNRRRISHDLEENSSKSKSNSRGAAGTRDVAEEIAVQKCCDCKARRRSHNFTNTACSCKRGSKNTAAAIMRDIQECINTKIAEKLEEKTISESEKDVLENSNHKDHKDLSQNVSIEEYDWLDKDELQHCDLVSQDLKQSFDLEKKHEQTNVEESSVSFKNKVGRRRKKRYRYSIDCKLNEKMETAYRSVFHDCIDFDTPRSAPSLKINMEESWKSEDSSDNDDEIHSSWRRSTLGSLTEECGNEVDGALVLARKIVSDDSTKDEKYDEEHETLNNACYKHGEVSDTFLPTARNNSFRDSDEDMEDMKFLNQRDEAKNIITYRNKNRTITRLTSDCSFVKDEDDDFKVKYDLYMVFHNTLWATLKMNLGHKKFIYIIGQFGSVIEI